MASSTRSAAASAERLCHQPAAASDARIKDRPKNTMSKRMLSLLCASLQLVIPFLMLGRPVGLAHPHIEPSEAEVDLVHVWIDRLQLVETVNRLVQLTLAFMEKSQLGERIRVRRIHAQSGLKGGLRFIQPTQEAG